MNGPLVKFHEWKAKVGRARPDPVKRIQIEYIMLCVETSCREQGRAASESVVIVKKAHLINPMMLMMMERMCANQLFSLVVVPPFICNNNVVVIRSFLFPWKILTYMPFVSFSICRFAVRRGVYLCHPYSRMEHKKELQESWEGKGKRSIKWIIHTNNPTYHVLSHPHSSKKIMA